MILKMEDLQRAWEARDPDLAGMICRLAVQYHDGDTEPVRVGAYSWNDFRLEMRSKKIKRLPREEQQHFRTEKIRLLESGEAEVPLPERLKLHTLVVELWEDKSTFARHSLLQVIRDVQLNYGPWKALKKIFKEAEDQQDWEVFGAITARFDMAYANHSHEPTRDTIGYLVRRAWRTLRRLGETLPVAYPDAACAVLANYTTSNYNWQTIGTWVLNHIWFHNEKKYTWRRFWISSTNKSQLKHRAFTETWQRTPRPLFSLLERAQGDMVRRYAAEALKTDFRATLREVEPDWVARLVNVRSSVIDEFVVWILNNVPRFEQAAFRELGLHDAVLKLFDSESDKAQKYAAEYARTHARDLTIDQLIKLANNHVDVVHKLACDLLLAREPRTEVGLEAWGRLLETDYGNELAAKSLRKHFGASELTPDWFKGLFKSENWQTVEFAQDALLQVHPLKTLGADYFCQLLDELDFDNYASRTVTSFCLEQLAKFDLNELDPEFLQRLILHPYSRQRTLIWANEGKLNPQKFPIDFLKTLAYHPRWEENSWVKQLKEQGPKWAHDLQFDTEVSENVLTWLRDVRLFSAQDLTFAWLMELVQRSETRYHSFAQETMIKIFRPADFAPAEAQEVANEPAAGSTPVAVDLDGKSFLFTGKLSTMTRGQAEGKVRTANGTVSKSVTKTLDYLVIGDEGSPLYGEGRKGSKQVKAESLIESGSELRIISETAFLEMLAGKQRTDSTDSIEAGCEVLWEMATGPGKADAPLARFARKYIRRHHPDIALAETDRPVDPGAEVPDEFLNFRRFHPLFADNRYIIRQFALEFAKWEFARWNPPIEGLVDLCESPWPEVRSFTCEAILADKSPEHRRYRIDPDVLTVDAVYTFCESRDPATRDLGMELIHRHPRLQLPQELFRLTESPDRKVRGFVIRTLWNLYRTRGTTLDWKPTPAPVPTLPAKTDKRTQAEREQEALEKAGPGVPARPENLPAGTDVLMHLLRRTLFEIPPARLDQSEVELTGVEFSLPHTPARKVKLHWIETLRDLAVEDLEFANLVLPLLREFLGSRGASEHAACLVALTRIERAHEDVESQLVSVDA